MPTEGRNSFSESSPYGLNITRLRQLAGRGVREGQAIDPSNPDLVYTAGRKDGINLYY